MHYYDVIMDTIASQIASHTIVYSTVYSDADQSKHQSPASLAFVREIHRGPMNSPHKWPVTRKMFPFDDVTMELTMVMWDSHAMMSTWKSALCSHWEHRADFDIISASLYSEFSGENWPYHIDSCSHDKTRGVMVNYKNGVQFLRQSFLQNRSY